MTNTVSKLSRMTPEMKHNQALATQGRRIAVSKKVAVNVSKKATPALGIDSSSYHLLDVLLCSTKQDDWGKNCRPVVIASTYDLSCELNNSALTVALCLKDLSQAGLLSYSERPCGEHDTMSFDLSPIKARIMELDKLASVRIKNMPSMCEMGVDFECDDRSIPRW